jgi:TonB family protein
MKNSLCTSTLALFVALSTAHGFAQSSNALKERLHQVASRTSLDLPDMKPWHLSMTFQILDAEGKTTQSGTIDEWWASPKLHKIVFTDPSDTWTEIQNEEGYYRSSQGTFPVDLAYLLRLQVIHPAPSLNEIDATVPSFQNKTVGRLTLDCVMLSHPLTQDSNVPFGLFPTYCLDPNQTSLRVSFDSGVQFIRRTNIEDFLGKSVPVDQVITRNDVVVARAHIESLKEEPLSSSDFIPTTGLTKMNDESAELVEGRIASQVHPVYPASAKSNHIEGTAVLAIFVGSNGHVNSLNLISAPSSDLAVAAITAVRQWVYQPALHNGLPVATTKTIQIHFNFRNTPR